MAATSSEFSKFRNRLSGDEAALKAWKHADACGCAVCTHFVWEGENFDTCAYAARVFSVEIGLAVQRIHECKKLYAHETILFN